MLQAESYEYAFVLLGAIGYFQNQYTSFFGRYIWMPYLLITVPVLIGVSCIPFAVKKWARRLKG